jgi:hypothetical protein
MRLAPNPISSGGIVELSLHAPAHVRADVVDMMGRTLFTITDEHAAASTRILPIDASQMSPGTYMLRVAIDGVVATERFVVTR